MSGFIYAMTNRAMPNLVKIGITSKHPLHRANELHTTGVPLPFTVAFAMWVHNPEYAEKATHQHFHQFRLSSAREFFEVGIEDVAKFVVDKFCLMNHTVVDFDYVFTESELEELCDRAELDHTACVTKMLMHVSGEAIAEAAVKYKQACEERRIRFALPGNGATAT
jgi:hypothetical protein